MNLPKTLQHSWIEFVHSIEPLRPELYRYCRHLTRSAWDAEDLVQDTLARAFVNLGQMMGQEPPNPRAWLFRVASNLWIDRTRKLRREQPLESHVERMTETDHRGVREAAGTLFGQLPPQERAAVVLKDVVGLSLEETADALSTTVGAVKAALHRARGKLVELPAEQTRAPAPSVLNAFSEAFNAGDMERLAALLLDNAEVEVVTATRQYGPEAAKRTVLYGMLYGAERMAEADVPGKECGMEPRFMQAVINRAPRMEVRAYRGEWVLVHWYQHRDGEFVRALTRIEAEGDRVAGLRNYFFTPEAIGEICAELELPFRSNGHRWCPPSA